MVVTTTVYSLYWPETRRAVESLWSSKPHGWYERNYSKIQDGMHEPFLAAWRDWSLVNLAGAFPHGYPVNGASEAIDHLILNPTLAPGRLHFFDGDYEGYARVAECRGMSVIAHPRSIEAAKSRRFRPGDVFWISHPSAIDGEYWDGLDGWLSEMSRRHPKVRVFLDVTYQGAVKRVHRLSPAAHPNVAAVVFSLSKPFGVYYHRVGGVFCREPVESLWGNLWFKNLFSIHLGLELMRRHSVSDLAHRYASTQEKIHRDLVAAGTLPPQSIPSNVVLLARNGTGQEAHRRAEGHYRFCLSPAMDKLINGGSP
jgi:histidinol-phosphate/aromatic aminotransferase/cobyric acid decarboxylase-like protein